ncbi:hypothetical protein NDU88_001038 [Pleurodeles waltl]|uniref:Secreted protein n=1 Tax=Pleurodeles waltl TaxID=8319 RepID=A0AAV7LAC7_PLEWA|nr:hypothetical protein NDU88_001038 [Pleurodeles waltl]
MWERVFTLWQLLGCSIPFFFFRLVFFLSGRVRGRLPCCGRSHAWAARQGLKRPHSREGARASSFWERCPARCTSLAVRGREGTRPHLRTRGDGGAGARWWLPTSALPSSQPVAPLSCVLGDRRAGEWGIPFSGVQSASASLFWADAVRLASAWVVSLP